MLQYNVTRLGTQTAYLEPIRFKTEFFTKNLWSSQYMQKTVSAVDSLTHNGAKWLKLLYYKIYQTNKIFSAWKIRLNQIKFSWLISLVKLWFSFMFYFLVHPFHRFWKVLRVYFETTWPQNVKWMNIRLNYIWNKIDFRLNEIYVKKFSVTVICIFIPE